MPLPNPDDEFEFDSFSLPKDDLGGNDLPVDVGNEQTGADEFAISFVEEDEGRPRARGQNESEDDDERSVDDLGDETSTRLHDEIQRERQRYADSERRWLEEREAMERQALEAEKRSIAAQTDSFKLALDGIDVRIQTAREALSYARQEDDFRAQTQIESQLDELNRMRSQIEGNMGQLPSVEDMDRAYQQHVHQRRQQMAQQRGSDDVRALNKKAEKWIAANKWFNDPASAQVKKSVMEVNAALDREGYDPNSDEFFRELTRRVAKRHPGVSVADIGGQRAGQQAPNRGQQRQSAPVASTRTANPTGGKSGKRKVDITPSERAMMKAFGLDMTDKSVSQRFAKEKFTRLNREANR